MNKLEIIEYLKTNNKSGSKTRIGHIKNKLPNIYDIVSVIDFIDDWYEKLFCYLNNIIEKPKCLNPLCNNDVNFRGYSKGYYNYCSTKCKNTDINFINKVKKNMVMKYGVDNPMKLNINVDKMKSTKKKLYGDENYVNNDKMKSTKKKLYGDENYNNREKANETSLKKYGNKTYTNREKAKETSLKKYGNEFYNNREKQFKTNIKKYGIKIYNNREKARKTSLEKYGETSYNKTIESKVRSYHKTMERLALKININYDDLQYDGTNFIVNNYCKYHENFIIDKYVLKNRVLYGIKDFCTKCNPVSENSSIKELELNNYILNELNIETKKFKINNKEIDIYLPEHKLGIEFNGLYWHSSLMIKPNQHLNKTELCEKNNIHLLHIFENEWIMKKDIVKSIIKSKLGLIDNKIFGRKTEIREIIDNKLVREFLNINHIQGFVGSKIKLGLYYNDELVTIMTFGKKRVSMGSKVNIDGEYEMLRFCNKLNTSVIGGASKLLKYFIRIYQPKTILTFADRRYSQGNLYKQLGFNFIGNTKPNYWYFKSHEYILHYRFKFRKDVLVKEGYDPNKTEQQIMAERGYLRIYDCGNIKYELKLE